MAEPGERQLHELLSRDMVDIYVGTENTHWILHEKLLCHRSKFFRKIFYNEEGSKNHAYGLPDEDDEPFRMFVGWLYSGAVPAPNEEKDLGDLFDLYLMGEKWEIRKLVLDVLEAVRKWYHDTDSWPAMRRVQYIYANTDTESPMRQLLVSCVAKMLVIGDGMPQHWENALRKNGQLAVDLILCVQKWHMDTESIPDAREESVVPIMENMEQRAEIKQEDDAAEAGHDLEGLANGVSGVSDEETHVASED
jgi:hypothetical protein